MNEKNKRVKGVAFLTAVSMMSMMFSIPVFADNVAEDYTCEIAAESKIDEKVVELMDDNSKEEISVYIFLKDFEDVELEESMDKKGIDMELYKNEEKFKEILTPAIAAEVVEKVGFEKAYEKDESKAFVKEPIGCNILNRCCEWESLAAQPNMVSEAINKAVKDYKIEHAKSVQELCTEYNQKFIEENNILEEDIIFNGELIRMLIVEATTEEIKKYADDADVEYIGYYEEIQIKPELCEAAKAVCADRSSGTKGSGYTGSGITIGLIETGRYQSSNPHLKDKTNLYYIPNPVTGKTADESRHATFVTSIICGDEKTVNGVKYEGIAPDATVYQTSADTAQMYSALEYMAKLGVDVINCSFGIANDTGRYWVYDMAMDKFISTNDIIVVCTAGNEAIDENGMASHGSISSPGMAFNAITVGNLNKVSSSSSGMYRVWDSSSYNEEYYLPNKPDISAPGNIAIATGTTTIDSANGTSLSAPIVTGVIAQMMQADPSLKTNPTLVKSKLLLAANDDIVSTENNPVVEYGSCLREKSGAGMVDAQYSVIAAVIADHKTITFENQSQIVKTQTFYGGQNLRIVMAMSCEDPYVVSEETGLDDADLVLLDSSGNIVAYSNSNQNNVEIIEYKVPKNDTYTIRVDNYGYALNPNAKPIISVSWLTLNN